MFLQVVGPVLAEVAEFQVREALVQPVAARQELRRPNPM